MSAQNANQSQRLPVGIVRARVDRKVLVECPICERTHWYPAGHPMVGCRERIGWFEIEQEVVR
ncbi:Uncharacterised protein [Mycobacteroides abscessus subsp. abscessus]|uniref:hypothetical protein n=1 Tax=Mycobacteroides abscessus TaxID=36809 RepID=UPI0009A63DAC|nr:hypothetical protein [Mycobacteroides abscessus]SKD91973.1 Uncharacterised protein [Mycobacteroides abscessus subsp. abscessus]